MFKLNILGHSNVSETDRIDLVPCRMHRVAKMKFPPHMIDQMIDHRTELGWP